MPAATEEMPVPIPAPAPSRPLPPALPHGSRWEIDGRLMWVDAVPWDPKTQEYRVVLRTVAGMDTLSWTLTDFQARARRSG